jgi:hypothetical protein
LAFSDWRGEGGRHGEGVLDITSEITAKILLETLTTVNTLLKTIQKHS